MTGVLLNPRTGRPEGDPPALSDLPKGRAVLANYAFPDVDVEREVYRAPEHVRANLARAQHEAPFEPRGSMQAWEEMLYAPLADGPTATAAAEATMVPIFTLPANYLYPGRVLKWTVMGRQSTAVTTPGTITLRLAYSATGLGAVVLAASGAFAPATTVATNLSFMAEWWTVCRATGTTGSAIAWGRIEWSNINPSTTATIVGNLAMDVAPPSAPAAVAIDTTVARALNPTYQPSVATASMTAHAAFLEALT